MTRLFVRKWGLTPARFDMMRIIDLYGTGGVGQQRIQDLLGVSAATVSRMLRSLEELGYVERERMDHDGRFKRVYATALGATCVRNALIRTVVNGVDERMVLHGLDFRPREARRKMIAIRGYLNRMRTIYGDQAPYEHPWTTLQLPIRKHWGPAPLQ